MTLTMYDMSVAVFRNRLTAFKAILATAEANAAERKIDAQVLLASRLSPDMFPLTRQVQIATDHAKGAPSRLAGREVPAFADEESSFGDLQGRIDRTLGHLDGFSAQDLDGSEDRTISFRAGGADRSLSGLVYLRDFAMPNFYFHLTTAYGILRHNGVPLGKRDFLGIR